MNNIITFLSAAITIKIMQKQQNTSNVYPFQYSTNNQNNITSLLLSVFATEVTIAECEAKMILVFSWREIQILKNSSENTEH